MLFYRTIVMTALTNEVEPLIRKWVNQALTAQYGTDWYTAYGRSIMADYDDFDKIQQQIRHGFAPIDTMDLTALLFLLLPYSAKNKNDGTSTKLTGAIEKVAEYYHWQKINYRGFYRIRSIRNHAIHDDFDPDLQLTIADIENGVQERKWLDDIENIIKPLKSSFHLQSYRMQLAQAVADFKNNTDYLPEYESLIQETESIRRACQPIYHFDFFDAPIVQPLQGAAPWSGATTNLDDLPWPSEQVSQAAFDTKPTPHTQTPSQPKRSPLHTQETSKLDPEVQAAIQKTAAKIEDTLNDTASKIEDTVTNGINKLFKWMNKKH